MVKNMKIVVACDSFKESMSALQACKAIQRGIHKVDSSIDVECIPMADGGEGTSKVLNEFYKGNKIICNALDAYGREIEAYYFRKEDLAIIEMACVCGLEQIETVMRHPLQSSSYGLGQVIFHAIDHGCKTLLIGLGGSATNDGGLGMLGALGSHFYDEDHKELEPIIKNIPLIESVSLCSYPDVQIQVACDVTNPYCGLQGATYTFGKQKGATKEELGLLESYLCHLNTILNIHNHPRTGAAGGTSGALYAIGAQLCSGIELVMKHTQFEKRIMDCDYCFTGEGSFDEQSLNGKTISGIASICKKHAIPLIVCAGKVKLNSCIEKGILACFSILNEISSLENALKEGEKNLEKTSENIMRLLLR